MVGKHSRKVARSLYLSLLPMQMLAIAVLNITGLLNGMIIGRFMGTDFLAVFGFVSPLNRIHSMIGGGIAVGSQILCGRYVGRGDSQGINRIYSVVVALCAFFGAVLTAAYLFFPEIIARALGASGVSLAYTVDYLKGMSWGMILMMLTTSMIPFLQLNNAASVMYIAIGAMGVVNIGGDLLCIFVLQTSMFGPGLAASLGYAAFTLVVLIYYLSDRCGVKIRLRFFSWKIVGEIFSLGSSNMLMCLCIALRTLLFNRVALAIAGPAVIAALAVVNNLCSLTDVLTQGIEGTTNMSASIFYGERDKTTLRELMPVALGIAAPLQVLLYVLVFFLAGPLSMLFGVFLEDVPYTVHVIRLYMIFPVTNILFSIMNNTYKGMGKVKLENVIIVTDFLVIPAILLFTLPKLFGIDGALVAIGLEEIFTTIGLIAYSAVKQRQFPHKWSRLTYIPEEFGVSGEDRYDASIRTPADISSVSERSIDFCMKKGMSRVKANFCGLCVEEMAYAILTRTGEREFAETRRKVIDLRILYEDQGITMLLRDNYPPFNPLEWEELQSDEDAMRHIGIRMVTKMAKSVEYSRAINLNLLTLRLDA